MVQPTLALAGAVILLSFSKAMAGPMAMVMLATSTLVFIGTRLLFKHSHEGNTDRADRFGRTE